MSNVVGGSSYGNNYGNSSSSNYSSGWGGSSDNKKNKSNDTYNYGKTEGYYGGYT